MMGEEEKQDAPAGPNGADRTERLTGHEFFLDQIGQEPREQCRSSEPHEGRYGT